MTLKHKRLEDENLLTMFRGMACCICFSRPSDPAHIKTQGSGGPDIEENLLPMCRRHHSEQHSKGFDWMCEKYPKLKKILEKKGWVFVKVGKFNKMFNKKVR